MKFQIDEENKGDPTEAWFRKFSRSLPRFLGFERLGEYRLLA